MKVVYMATVKLQTSCKMEKSNIMLRCLALITSIIQREYAMSSEPLGHKNKSYATLQSDLIQADYSKSPNLTERIQGDSTCNLVYKNSRCHVNWE